MFSIITLNITVLGTPNKDADWLLEKKNRIRISAISKIYSSLAEILSQFRKQVDAEKKLAYQF